MQKLVKLSLDGQIDRGYQVELVEIEIKEKGKEGRTLAEGVKGKLAPANHIYEQYQDWQSLYKALAALPIVRALQNRDQDIFRALKNRGKKLPSNVSVAECQKAAYRLKGSFNQWLADPNFSLIDRNLLKNLEPEDKIRFLIKTTDTRLWQLPWSAWKLFEEYPNAEVGFSPIEFKGFEKPIDNRRRKKVRILAIGGDKTGINYEEDQESLTKLKSVGAEPEIVNEPSPRQFRDLLWNKKWDILFYSGHSKSEEDLQTGQIYLTNSDVLEAEDLELTLKKAIDNGLKIAIFNSCEGLGLARKLVEYGMPIVIAMREPVPNDFAVEFVKYFLVEYANNNQSLYLAVRQAKERLIDEWREKLPSIDWLPVICQNPAIRPLAWTDLHRPVSVSQVAVASVACTSLVLLMRLLGLLEPMELPGLDRLMQMRPPEEPDKRLLVVAVDESYIQAKKEYPIEDATVIKLLRQLEGKGAKVIGLDIYRDIPRGSSHQELLRYMQENDSVIAVCKSAAPEDGAPNGIKPPEGIPENRVGFSDVVADSDGWVRRHLLSITPYNKSVCVTEFAFSSFLAFHYLYQENVKIDLESKDWQVGDAVLKRLTSRAGGYQEADASGYQLLLNYRSLPNIEDVAETVSIQEVLDGNVAPDLIKDRIVLIGMTTPVAGDTWNTPYPSRQEAKPKKLPGVFIQAHMVSQIISAAIDGRPLIWVLPQWGDMLFILVWSVAGGAIIWFTPSSVNQKLILGASLIVLLAVCWAILILGGWLPLIPSALALVSANVALAAHTSAESSEKSWISEIKKIIPIQVQ